MNRTGLIPGHTNAQSLRLIPVLQPIHKFKATPIGIYSTYFYIDQSFYQAKPPYQVAVQIIWDPGTAFWSADPQGPILF